MRKKYVIISLYLLVFNNPCFWGNQVKAVPEVFTIDSSQSQITLSGKLAGYTVTQQGAGSLETSYSGSINANLTTTNIQFTGSSLIGAQTNGVWQPAVGGGSGSAPADYGAEASVPLIGTAYGALRSIVLDLTSPLLVVSNGNFDSTALVFSFPTNSSAKLDYNAGLAGAGSESLAGLSTNTVVNGATLTTSGMVQKLVIQINTQFTFTLISSGDTTLGLNGQIVATNSLVPPVITSVVLSNQNVVISVENADLQSQLQSSTNLTIWSSANANVTSNSGLTVFTVPFSAGNKFFRVQK